MTHEAAAVRAERDDSAHQTAVRNDGPQPTATSGAVADNRPLIRLSRCTLTGVDDKTPLDALEILSTTYPIAEWGFLYSPKQQGQGGRYPRVGTIEHAFETLPEAVNVALHVCGQGVPGLLYGSDTAACELFERLKARKGRLQLNFKIGDGRITFGALATFLHRHQDITVITQFNAANAEVWKSLKDHPNHAVLFDASGGQGASPSDGWRAPLPGVSCGYAGGLGPDNLRAELRRIGAVTPFAPTWVDMEGKLRYPYDVFSFGAARECLDIATTAATVATQRSAND